MINNKGQSLVLFILIIPILMGIMALVVEGGRMMEVKSRQESICRLSLEYGFSRDKKEEKDVVDLLKLNLKDTKYQVNLDDDVVYVTLEDDVEGILGKLFGFVHFKVKSKYRGYFKDEEKVIEKIS